jgi:hypothetical protein
VGDGDVPSPPRSLGRDPGLTSSVDGTEANRTLGSPRGPLPRCRPHALADLVLRTAPVALASPRGRRLGHHRAEAADPSADTTPALERASSHAAACRAEGSLAGHRQRPLSFVEPDESTAHGVRSTGLWAVLSPGARSAVKHRPADVVPQPLVVNYELANRLWELVTLPPALESPCDVALAFRRASTCGLDRIGGRTEFVRGDVRDDSGLASSVRGMPCCPTQVSGRGHCTAGRRASLGHLHLATHPGASMLDRLTRSWVFRLSRLEQVKDMLRARCRPKSEELVIRIGEGPTAADRHQVRVSDLREDHGWHLYTCIRSTPYDPRRRARMGYERLLRANTPGPDPRVMLLAGSGGSGFTTALHGRGKRTARLLLRH